MTQLYTPHPRKASVDEWLVPEPELTDPDPDPDDLTPYARLARLWDEETASPHGAIRYTRAAIGGDPHEDRPTILNP